MNNKQHEILTQDLEIVESHDFPSSNNKKESIIV